MRGRALELIVKGAMLLQYAVEHVRCDPPRCEAGHFGGAG
jgi:hypothetical protein